MLASLTLQVLQEPQERQLARLSNTEIRARRAPPQRLDTIEVPAPMPVEGQNRLEALLACFQGIVAGFRLRR